jgi:hypothetical protein
MIHTLVNGATVLVLIPGEKFSFSDKTVYRSDEHCFELITSIKEEKVFQIKNMPVFSSKHFLSDEQIAFLKQSIVKADIVLVPQNVVRALKSMDLRDQFPNVVSYNITKETESLDRCNRVIDIERWSY